MSCYDYKNIPVNFVTLQIFQGNTNNMHEVRNNFIPPIEARYVRINPTQWYHRINLKLELLGCLLPMGEGWTLSGKPFGITLSPTACVRACLCACAAQHESGCGSSDKRRPVCVLVGSVTYNLDPWCAGWGTDVVHRILECISK